MSDADAGNVLLIFSDQHTRRAMGCLGHPVIKTPNMDRLAENGTLFRHAYTNGPICVPARASLATGRYVHDIAKWDNCMPYLGEQASWGHRLMAQGRRSVSVGKLHYRSIEDPTGFDSQLLPLHVLDGVGMLFTICRDPMPSMKRFRQLVHEAGEGDSTYTDYDRDITARAVTWIQDEGARSEKPWTLFVSLVCPHPPWRAPSKFWNQYPLEDIDLPVAYLPGERPEHPGLSDFRRFFSHEEPFEEPVLRSVIAAYYGMISYLDDNIGKLLAALADTGIADRTRVIYTSDHGESMGQKGMFSKCNMFEESVGIPMILNGPGVPAANAVDAPTQLLDVFPTVLECTGTEPTDEDRALPGTSLLRIAEGERPQRSILSEQHSAGARSAVFMLRRDRYKYVKYMHGYPAQLYDLDKDPLERTDLGQDPAHRATLERFDAALRDILDPEAVDAAAKADQHQRLEAAGGMDAIVARGSPGYTPAPGEEPKYM